MNIGYDAKRLFNNFTGLGNYSRDLVDAMSESYPQHSYYLYTPSVKTNNRTIPFINNDKLSVITPDKFPWKYMPHLWRTKGIIGNLKNDKINIYHGLSHELPIGIEKTGIKSIVTIHDLIFYLYPSLFPWIDRKIYFNKFNHACHVSDRIIAISECTKKDIINIFSIDPDKIEVIYQDCNPIFSQTCSQSQKKEVSAKYNLSNKFILYVGSIEKRKNLFLAIKALKEVDSSLSLVAVGKPTPYLDEIKKYINENKLENRIKFLHNIGFNELPVIYQLAEIFVYPSFYEGFGLPVLEALKSGIPVIAAKGSCLEEAGGPDSIYIDPKNSTSLAYHINEISNNNTTKQEMIDKGHLYAEKFSKTSMVQKIMRTYMKCL